MLVDSDAAGTPRRRLRREILRCALSHDEPLDGATAHAAGRDDLTAWHAPFQGVQDTLAQIWRISSHAPTMHEDQYFCQPL